MISIPSLILLIFGEAIIISAFLLVGEPSHEKYLCMSVSSVIYILLCWQSFVNRWINLKDKAQRGVGSLGVKWLGIFLYSFVSILAMVGCNLLEVPFEAQVIIHCVLFFFLLVYIFTGRYIEQKTADVHAKEAAFTENRDILKFELNNLRRKISVKNDFPNWIFERISKMEDEARYIAPNDSPQAQSLDKSFLESLKKLETAIDFDNLEQVKTDELLKMCEITLTERKKALN